MGSNDSFRARLALTGAGLVTSVGLDLPSSWRAIRDGRRGIDTLTLFDPTGHRSTIAAEVRALPHVESADGVACSRTDTMAILAAREAIASAKIDLAGLRVGVVLGGTTGGLFETESILARMLGHLADRRPIPGLLSHPLSATLARMSALLGPFARARTVCSACSSGANAFAIARAWLERDDVEVALVGGSDALCRLTFAGFNALGAIDPEAARPFDRRRRGLSIGEGAGFAIVERIDRASDRARLERRGVAPWAELVGVGIVSEAHHITNPESSGASPARAIARALADAGISADSIDYVNAHGTGTPLNDAMESAALVSALGDSVARALVSSTKGVTGHTLGAAGAIEAIVTALAIRDGVAPPTAGLEEIDPACAALSHVIGREIEREIDVALSSSFGFGGVDTVLAFAKPRDRSRSRARVRSVVVRGVGSASRLGALAPLNPAAGLDPARARRLDRSAKLAAIATLATAPGSADGVVLGSAYGDTDASAAFVARLIEKGPRLAPPADFPNLVPSSPSGHVSIFHGLKGPALAVADLSTSGEAAIATALDFLAISAADSIVVGALEGPNELVRQCIAPAIRAAREGGTESPALDRSEGCAVVRLVAIDDAAIDGDVVIERARELATIDEAFADRPRPGSLVIVAEVTTSIARARLASAWSATPIESVIAAVGRHEGLGGFAIAAASALLLRGDFRHVRVVGEGEARVFAIDLRRHVEGA